jgi:hypothetical protein
VLVLCLFLLSVNQLLSSASYSDPLSVCFRLKARDSVSYSFRSMSRIVWEFIWFWDGMQEKKKYFYLRKRSSNLIFP